MRRKACRANWSGLEVDWTDVEQLYERYGLTPAAPSQASRVAVPLYSGEKQVGKATTTSWSPTLKKMIALASVETEHAKPGTSLQMEITIEAMRLKTNVKVTNLPFFNPAEEDCDAGIGRVAADAFVRRLILVDSAGGPGRCIRGYVNRCDSRAARRLPAQ